LFDLLICTFACSTEVEYNANSGSWQAGGRGQLSQPSLC